MVELLQPLPWASGTVFSIVPVLDLESPQHTIMRSTIRHNPPGDFKWAQGVQDTFISCDEIGKLATLMQKSLFFDLLTEFLDTIIRPADFIKNGNLDMNSPAAHGYFTQWRTSVSQLSYRAQRTARERRQALITFAREKSHELDRKADALGHSDLFDRVSLSTQLVICLLQEISDDTFSLIGPPAFGVSSQWVRQIASRLTSRHRDGIFWMKVDRTVLGETLLVMDEDIAREHLRSRPRLIETLCPETNQLPRAMRYLCRTFVLHVWCPYRALQLCQSYEYPQLNMLAPLVPQNPTAQDHARCVELRRCDAHTLSVDGPGAYPYSHHGHAEGESCAFVNVPLDDLVRILEAGSTPLISVSREGELDLQVIESNPYIAYTAISHVWSDGLGNRTANALPQCQLLRLRQLIAETYDADYSPFYDGSTPMSSVASKMRWTFWRARQEKWNRRIDKNRVYFWMDTLCIPAAAPPWSLEWMRDLKFLGMKHITPIFSTAENTLVLESELEQISFDDPSHVCGDEIAARILSSKWMQRGWTMEEGSLSRELVFQIASRPYKMQGALTHSMPIAKRQQSPIERANIKFRRILPLIVRRALLEERWMSTGGNWRKRSKLQELLNVPCFVWAWNGLLSRATTKPDDGPLILANLMEFNISAIKDMPSEMRLKVVLQSCDELPLSLLYNTSDQRLLFPNHPELGWIPTNIASDPLTVSGSLRKQKQTTWDNKIVYVIERSDCNPRSLLVFRIIADSSHLDFSPFLIKSKDISRSAIPQEFVILLHARSYNELNDGLNMRPHGVCIIIDMDSGVTSPDGCSGRGVQLSIETERPGAIVLKYGIPLTAWTWEQWRQKTGQTREGMAVKKVKFVKSSHRLALHFDANLWCKPLFRRPTLNLYPIYACVAGILVMLPVLLICVTLKSYTFSKIREALGINLPIFAFFTTILGIYAFGPMSFG